jgi:alpha-tubulin suppressor-like RCC1 family protein
MNTYDEFTLFFQDFSIQELCLGLNHLLFLTKSNELYVMGSNDHGEIGFGRDFDEYDLSTPIKHKFFINKPIHKIAAGDRHSLVLTNEGEVFSFGDNSFGQCSGFENKQYSPKSLYKEVPFTAVDIYSGPYHNFLLSSEGDLYSWGDNSFDKLGYPLGNSNQISPKLVPYLKGYSIGNISLAGQQSIIVTTSKKECLLSISNDWYDQNKVKRK